MNRRVLLYLGATLLALLALAVGGGSVLASRPSEPPAGSNVTAQASQVTAELQQAFTAAGPGSQLQYFVVLKDQADTSNTIPNDRWSEKGWYVYNILTRKAEETQKGLLGQLVAMQKAGQVSAYQGRDNYWYRKYS